MSSGISKEDYLHSLNSVARSPEGKVVLIWLLHNAGIYDSSFAGDNNQTNFNEGRRSIALDLLNDMAQADKNLYYNLIREMQNG